MAFLSADEEKEINNKTTELSSASNSFTMSHSVFATENYLKFNFDEIKNPVIRVFFVDDNLPGSGGYLGGRTEHYKFTGENDKEYFCFNIYLPQTNDTITYKTETRSGKIIHGKECNRYVMAHELAHLYLHPFDVISKKGTIGIRERYDNKDDINEEKADSFALNLCNLRDKQLRKHYADTAREEMKTKEPCIICWQKTKDCWLYEN